MTQLAPTASPQKRPGPFGPAWALLPKDQQLTILPDDRKASEVLSLMINEKFSQVPIRNQDNRVVGVFTWESFSKRVLDLMSAPKINVADLPAKELMEPARFISPDTYIDTETDWGQVDYVLVGDADNVQGILCISDVLGRLNDFAEAFVLLYEIEHEIRDLIGDVADKTKLGELIDNIKQAANSRPLQSLEDFAFGQYRSLICTKDNWPHFEPVFDRMRDLVNVDFGEINELRNMVFHFRGTITPQHTDRLRRFRDRLRYDREVFACKRAEIATAE
jgi:hypothetical protein